MHNRHGILVKKCLVSLSVKEKDLYMKNKNIIIVTGASSGMGKEFVKQIDKKFPKVDEIWLIARRKEVLKELAKSCNHVCRILAYDLCEKQAQQEIRTLLEREQPRITLLVNSAGYGVLRPFYQDGFSQDKKIATDTNWMNEQTGMVSLNCEVLTVMTHLCIPFIKKGGRIIQLASSAAFLPQPKFAVYAATKSYVLSFSRALNEELRSRQIHVTAVCPGPVDTEFFDRAEKGNDTLFIKKIVMAKPEKVVEKALLDARNKKDVSVYSLPIQAFYVVSKLLSHKLMLIIMRAMK